MFDIFCSKNVKTQNTGSIYGIHPMLFSQLTLTGGTLIFWQGTRWLSDRGHADFPTGGTLVFWQGDHGFAGCSLEYLLWAWISSCATSRSCSRASCTAWTFSRWHSIMTLWTLWTMRCSAAKYSRCSSSSRFLCNCISVLAAISLSNRKTRFRCYSVDV